MQVKKSALRLFAQISLASIFALVVSGCTHGTQQPQMRQQETQFSQASPSYAWHDGSRHGLYGIGEGWSIEILSSEFEKVTETVSVSHTQELIVIPAEYEWIKDDIQDLNAAPASEVERAAIPKITELVTIPATFEMMTDTVTLEEARNEYRLIPATFNMEGRLKKPATVEEYERPAVTKQRERKVIKTPERVVERTISVPEREGYRREVKIPAQTVELPWYPMSRSESRMIEVQPWRFIIRNPDGDVLHMFETFEALTAFTDSLK